MALTTSINLEISNKLHDIGYRHRFFARMAQDEIASRIKSLRSQRGLRQADLAQLSGMKQSAVSRIEQSEYSGWTFNTLLRVAKALDVRLRVIFEPMEEVMRQYQKWETAQREHESTEYKPVHALSAFRALAELRLDRQLQVGEPSLMEYFVPVRSTSPDPFAKVEAQI